MDTLTSIRARLHGYRGAWPSICEATGLSYDWMCKFAQKRIADPGLSKIEKLQAHLDELDAAAAVAAAAAAEKRAA